MDKFEERLKSLTVPEPSEALEQKIFAGGAPRRRWRGVLDVRIPLGWAALFVMAAGIGGFLVARSGGGTRPVAAQAASAVVQVKVVEAPAAHHVFDFTEPAQEFLPGTLQVQVDTNNGG